MIPKRQRAAFELIVALFLVLLVKASLDALGIEAGFGIGAIAGIVCFILAMIMSGMLWGILEGGA